MSPKVDGLMVKYNNYTALVTNICHGNHTNGIQI